MTTTQLAPFVSAAELADLPEAVIVDVRHYLDGRDGAAAYAEGHLPGARFIAMDQVLAAPASPEAGRHPLPDPAVFAAGMGAAGIGPDATVIAYDDAGGTMAARLVWMLRALGVRAALLDGGMQSWQGELTTEVPLIEAVEFPVRTIPETLLADIDAASDPNALVIDSRAAERYRGETEPIDAVAGHIPGARNLPVDQQLSDGHLAENATIRQNADAAGLRPDQPFVAYCGSGISAAFNLLAMEQAGFTKGRLYPGSWSQYSASGREVATGDEGAMPQNVSHDTAATMENAPLAAPAPGPGARPVDESEAVGDPSANDARTSDHPSAERSASESAEERAALWTNLVALLGGVLIALALTFFPISNTFVVIGVLITVGMICLMFGRRGSSLRGLGNAMLFGLGLYLMLFGFNLERLASQGG